MDTPDPLVAARAAAGELPPPGAQSDPLAQARQVAAAASAYTGQPDLPISSDLDTGIGNALAAFGHNAIKPFHMLAQGVENAAQWAGNQLPDNPVSQYISKTADSDRAALANWESQYQQSVPTDTYSRAGAVGGSIAPLAAGGAALLGKGAKVVADATTEAFPSITPFLQKVVGGVAAGTLAAPAYVDPAAKDYGLALGETAGTGAIVGSAVPALTAPVSSLANALKGVYDAKFNPEVPVQNSVNAMLQARESGQQLVAPYQRQGAVASQAQQAPVGEAPPANAEPNYAALAGGTEQRAPVTPGVQFTTAQTTPSPDLIQAEQTMRNDPKLRLAFNVRDAQNNGAYLSQIQTFTKTPEELQALVTARNAAMDPVRAQVTQNPADATPILDSLEQMRKSSFGTDPVIKKAIASLSDGINQSVADTGAGGNLVSADLLDGYRQNVRSFLTDNASNGVVASKQEAAFGPIKNAITTAIDGANPGYRNYLEAYREASAPINSAEAANRVMDRFANSPNRDVFGQPRITLSAFNSTLDRVQDLDYGLTPQANQAFEGIRQDLVNEATTNAGRPIGSPTAFNLQAPGWLAGKLFGENLQGGIADKAAGHWIGKMLGNAGAPARELQAQALLDPEYFAKLATQSRGQQQMNLASQLMQGK